MMAAAMGVVMIISTFDLVSGSTSHIAFEVIFTNAARLSYGYLYVVSFRSQNLMIVGGF